MLALPLRAKSASANSQGPLKIGFIVSLTGVGEKGGKDEVNGAKLYLDQLHNTIAGRKVDLVVENDESNPSKGVEKFVKLVNEDKVQIVDGLTFSHIALAVARANDKYHVPLVVAIPGANDITERKRSDWTVRTSFSSSQASLPFGEWVAKRLKYKRVSILGANFPYSWESGGGFQTTFEKLGGKIIQRLWVPLGFQDFSAFIAKIPKDGDAIYVVTIGSQESHLPKQLRDAFPNMPIIAAGPTFEETALATMHDEALGAITSVTYTCALNTPENKHFVKAYRAKYGDDPSQFSEGGYTSMMAIHQAAESIKGDVEDGSKFLSAMKHIKLTAAPRGPIKLDSYGNPIENVYICRVEKVNGKLQQTVIDTIKNVSQFWNEKPEDVMARPPFSADYPPCNFCSEK